MIWNILAGVFVAVVFTACQKDQSDAEDMETWIVKNYFLPDDKRRTVESSFELCEINNKAIENLRFIYESQKKDLGIVVDELNKKRIVGNCDDCQDDPRQNEIVTKVGEWGDKIESGSMTPEKLAYEYAFFQHWLYLKYTEKIQDVKIRKLYQDVKSNSIDGCLKPNMTDEAKSGKRPNFKTPIKDKKDNKKGQKGLRKKTGPDDSNTNLYLFAAILMLFLVEWKRRFKDIRRAGRYIFGQFKKTGAPSYQTPVTSANSTPAWGNQHQTEMDSQQQYKQEPKISINEKYAIKANTIQTAPEQKKENNPEKPVVTSPSVTEKEHNTEKPALSPLQEPKKEAIPERQVHIPPSPEPKKQESVQSEVTYGTSTLFARIPSGNLFFGLSSQPEYPDTPFVIDERNGTFDLVKDPETLERLFSMIDQLKDACELMNINQPDLNTYQVRAKGEVVREGDYWRISKKLKLDWK